MHYYARQVAVYQKIQCAVILTVAATVSGQSPPPRTDLRTITLGSVRRGQRVKLLHIGFSVRGWMSRRRMSYFRCYTDHRISTSYACFFFADTACIVSSSVTVYLASIRLFSRRFLNEFMDGIGISCDILFNLFMTSWETSTLHTYIIAVVFNSSDSSCTLLLLLSLLPPHRRWWEVIFSPTSVDI